MAKRKPKKKSAAPVKVQSRKKPSARKTASKSGSGHPAISAKTMDGLIEGAKYQQHPYGKVWQKFDLGTFSELVGNVDRRGLDLEILLYQGMVLEGWHRYLACLHTGTKPKFSAFEGTDREAAERVHSSGLRRPSTPEQRYAAFLLLEEACPAFKEQYEELSQKGGQQRATGKPLSTDGQRVDVVKTKAKAAGVGRSTAAKVEKVKKENPKAVAKIASGATTANKELAKVKKGKGREKSSGESVVAAPSQGRPLDELKGMIQRFEDFLQGLAGVDWSRENEKEWGKAGSAVSQAVGAISAKAKEGFHIAKKTKALTKARTQTRPGKTITIRKLRHLYSKQALKVLDGYLEEIPKMKKGVMRACKILKQLPDIEEFYNLQTKRFTSTVAVLVDNAFSEFEFLASELSGWYDDLPDGLQSTSKADEIQDAADIMEGISRPEVSAKIGAVEVFYLPIPDAFSKPDCRDDAVGCLRAVIAALNACRNERDDNEEIKNLLDQFENAISQAESVEFPGMY